MKKLLDLLTQRRVWAAIISTILFVLGVFGVDWSLDSQTLTDLVMKVVEALGSLVAGVLALYSYLKPKS